MYMFLISFIHPINSLHLFEDPRFSKKSYLEIVEFIEISMRSTFELLNFIGDKDRLTILMNHSISFGKFFSEDCSVKIK